MVGLREEQEFYLNCVTFSVSLALRFLFLRGTDTFGNLSRAIVPFLRSMPAHTGSDSCGHSHRAQAEGASVTGVWAAPSGSRDVAEKDTEPAHGWPPVPWRGTWERDSLCLAVLKCIEKNFTPFS